MEGGHLVGVFHLLEEERHEAVEMIVIMIGSEGTIQGEIGIGNGGGGLLNAVQGGMGGTKMRYDYPFGVVSPPLFLLFSCSNRCILRSAYLSKCLPRPG